MESGWRSGEFGSLFLLVREIEKERDCMLLTSTIACPLHDF
jgi:hypothetical protein